MNRTFCFLLKLVSTPEELEQEEKLIESPIFMCRKTKYRRYFELHCRGVAAPQELSTPGHPLARVRDCDIL